jgi:hypothetical protein
MEMDTGTGGALTVQEPGNPALDAARAEMTEIATNPAHPKYDGYQRGDREVSDYLDALYKKAVPDTGAERTLPAPAPHRDTEQDTMTREDRVAQTEVDTMLRQTLGDSYDGEMASMRIASQHLFATAEGKQALAALAPILTELGPLAEVRAIRFLAEIGDMVRTHKGA